jgi:phage-related protein
MCYALSVDWRVTFYSSRVEDAILRLPAGLLARFVRYAETMESFGPQLGMPHSRALGGGLYELRLKGPEGIARALYTNLPSRRIAILHVFVKKTAKIPAKELDTARRRLKEMRDA